LFYLDSNNKCLKCNDACSSCKSDLSCICELNYYKNLDNDTCEACTNNCLSCRGPGLNDCVICNVNFVEIEGKCEFQCLDGYRKQLIYKGNTNFNRCIKCIDNCLSCPDYFGNCSKC
jgi:proprotein convertase subtilisin/kexin type 5